MFFILLNDDYIIKYMNLLFMHINIIKEILSGVGMKKFLSFLGNIYTYFFKYLNVIEKTSEIKNINSGTTLKTMNKIG